METLLKETINILENFDKPIVEHLREVSGGSGKQKLKIINEKMTSHGYYKCNK